MPHSTVIKSHVSLCFLLQKSLEEKHSAEVTALSNEISALKLKAAELEMVKQELEKVKIEHHSVVEAKQWLERRLPEVEVNII